MINKTAISGLSLLFTALFVLTFFIQDLSANTIYALPQLIHAVNEPAAAPSFKAILLPESFANREQLPGVRLDVPYVDQIFAQRRIECQIVDGFYDCRWTLCGPSSVAMVLSYLDLEERDVTQERQPTLDLICQTKYGCRGPASNLRMVSAIENAGAAATLVDLPSLHQIQQSIDQGLPVIISIEEANHIAVVTGYRGHTLILNDPFGAPFWWYRIDDLLGNQPANGQPDFRGQGVEYRFGEDFTIRYAIFVSAAATRISSETAPATDNIAAKSSALSNPGTAEKNISATR